MMDIKVRQSAIISRRDWSWLVIAIVALVLAAIPLFNASNIFLNAMISVLIIALAGQGWNILGGFAGQFSFGHAAFFGTGAYVIAILQVKFGWNAWAAFGTAIVIAGCVGFLIGYLSFRSGLRGSYFALVTLAFAEVFRILANAAPLTGGAAGTLIPLRISASNFQFSSRVTFYEILLGVVVASLLVAQWLHHSRFGAYLVAVRENEDAARALGVDILTVKLKAIAISAMLTGAAGAFYAQNFLFIDANIAFGTWISVEALLAPIIGGLGTVLGPLFGALILHFLGEFAKTLAGKVPGLDLALYGALLVLVIAFARDGLTGLFARIMLRVKAAGGGS